ncbi:hypothetical protein E6W39_00545 [Kitasatospora acidiphila]|uniref:Uncharacterized protein n=1 Tax=Kitasatospora acidiphila TaxID=2567942 RepID=A0A540WGB1_9ACTN|nr:hypothetical protein [Kitasatospora acidiphila]TQF08069.1 hypothetical protein E6W39_00545 [Kitasatospora acidiphila]
MSDRMLRLALRLHPAAYRREWGEEIAAVFADTTAGAGRWATARELLDLAGHGMRGRLGLGSAGRPARIAAIAAPFAAGAAAGATLVNLYVTLIRGLIYADSITWPFAPWGPAGHHPLRTVGELVCQFSELLLLAAAVAALLGRWSLSRLLAPVGVLAGVAGPLMQLLPMASHSVERLLVDLFVLVGPQTIWAATVFAAPRDLLGPANWRRTVALLAGLLLAGPMLYQFMVGEPFTSIWLFVNPQLLLVVVVTFEVALVTAGALALRWDRLGLAAAAVAGLPVGVLGLLAVAAHPNPIALTAAVLTLGVMIAALLIGRRGRSMERGPSSPTAMG